MKIKLTKPQWKVWKGKTRFKVLICGRRFGKTFLALAWLINQSQMRKGICYYVAPSYVMGKQIAWRMLKDFTDGMVKQKNESELYVEMHNGSIIQIKGADNPDALRGVSLSALVMDEFAFMQHEVWTEALRPATSDQMAPVLFISSPSGWNWAKDLYDFARQPEVETWEAWTFTTAEGGNVPQSEIEAARLELPERTFRQEYMASFEALSNRVYSNFDRERNVTEDVVTPGTSGSLLVGMDFNVTPMSCVIAKRVLVDPASGREELHIIDEIAIEHSNTTEMAAELHSRYPHHRLTVYPDPSGRSRKTSAVGGMTDFSILESAGFYVKAPKKAPAVADRINEVQAMLLSSSGDVRMKIHPKCTELIKCLGGMTYKPKTSQPDKSLGLDHMPDALGYMVHGEFPIIKRVKNFEVTWSA